MNWYRLSISKVFELLGSGPEGLSSAMAEERLLETGPNQLEEGKKKKISTILLAQFKDVMILILFAAAIISGFIGDLTDTIVILIIVVLNGIIGFIQEYRAEKAMLALKKMAIADAKVLRDEKVSWLPSTSLVPGDVVILEAGNSVPADMRIIESFNLKIEEAALTGESNPVDKISTEINLEEVAIGDR